MYEIFLFVNPIGIYCYDTEQELRRVIRDLDLEVSFHIIPISSVAIIKEDVHRRRCKGQTLENVSYYTHIANRALADYHAIKIMYGNKRARAFLIELQKRIQYGTDQKTVKLTDKVISDLNMSVTKISELRETDYVQDSIKQDRKICDQWNITKTPTTVIFNEDDATENGVMLEDTVSKDALNSIFIPDRPQAAGQNEYLNTNINRTSHLHIL